MTKSQSSKEVSQKKWKLTVWALCLGVLIFAIGYLLDMRLIAFIALVILTVIVIVLRQKITNPKSK